MIRILICAKDADLVLTVEHYILPLRTYTVLMMLIKILNLLNQKLRHIMVMTPKFMEQVKFLEAADLEEHWLVQALLVMVIMLMQKACVMVVNGLLNS